MRRLNDGSHEETGYRLELEPWTGNYRCSCGSEARLVVGRYLYGCWAEVSHGCRNVEELNEFLRGIRSAVDKRLEDNGVSLHE